MTVRIIANSFTVEVTPWTDLSANHFARSQPVEIEYASVGLELDLLSLAQLRKFELFSLAPDETGQMIARLAGTSFAQDLRYLRNARLA